MFWWTYNQRIEDYIFLYLSSISYADVIEAIECFSMMDKINLWKSELSKNKWVCIFRRVIFRLKIKLNIWGISEFFMVFYSICSLSFIHICPYFTKVETPAFWRLQVHTCKVKLSHALDATHTICSKCKMKLKQKPGEENLLISKPKALSFNTAIILCMNIFLIKKSLIFFIYRQTRVWN